MRSARPIRVLLTVPHLTRMASPYREMLALAKHLPKEQVDLTVCSLRTHGLEETAPVLQTLGVPVFVAGFRPKRPTVGSIWGSLRQQRKLRQAGPFEIQHSLDFTSSPFEGLFARMRCSAYVFSQRNMNQEGHTFWLRCKGALANKVIAISNNTQGLMRNSGVPARRLAKVYNGLDLEEVDRVTKALPARQGGYILSVGHISPLKRHEDAIRALAILRQNGVQVKLLVAGAFYDEAHCQKLRRLSSELGLADQVEFLGQRSDVLELMRRAEAMVFCSESEGLPWVVLEAMALGVPLVASSIEANQELIRHERNGLLVKVGDAEGYAKSVNRIMTEPALAQQMTTEARRQIEAQFSAPKMAREMLQVYRSLCR